MGKGAISLDGKRCDGRQHDHESLAHWLHHGYFARRLLSPLATKDGPTLTTVGDARSHILKLPQYTSERRYWQKPVEPMHAILDRLVHNAYRLTLKGESLRKAVARRHNLDAEPNA